MARAAVGTWKARELKRLTTWLNREAFGISGAGINEVISKKQPLSNLFGSLGGYANEVGGSGLGKLLVGDAAGWVSIRESFQMTYWELCIVDAARKSTHPRSLVHLSTAVLAYCSSIVFGWHDVTPWTAKMLVESVENRFFDMSMPQTSRSWTFNPLFPLVLEMAASQAEQVRPNVEPARERPEAYRLARRSFSSGENVAEAIVEMCDEHAYDTSHDYLENFASYYPTRLLPIEVLAFIEILRQRGVDIPRVDHPVLWDGAWEIPTTIPEEMNVLGQDIIKYSIKALPVLQSYPTPW